MMKPLYKQPLIEAAILASGIMCTVLLIHGVQNFIAMGGKPATSQIAEKSNPDLVQVAAGSFALGDTCNRPGVCSANNYSPDDPPVINPGSVPEAYDLDRYALKETVSGTHAVSPAGFQQSEVDGAGADMYPKLCTMFGNTFPKTFTKAAKHRSNVGDNNTPSADGATVFEFTLPAGTPITVPVSGRNILHGLDSAGNGPEGMIMYAAADRFAFQIGRKDFLKNIWIYVMDVDVDPGLVSAYQSANAAGRDKLPEVTTGQVLATSRGTVRIGVRDVGKLLDLRHIYPWDPGFITSLGIAKRCTQDTSAPLPDGGGPNPPPPSDKLGLGKDCTKPEECLSNRCAINPPTNYTLKCLQGTLEPPAPCTDSSQCVSNKCEVTSTSMGKFVCVTTAAPPVLPPSTITHNVSGTISLAETPIGTYTVRVNILTPEKPPALKYWKDFSSSLAYSIPGVVDGTYTILAELIKDNIIISTSPDTPLIISGSNKNDVNLSIPAPVKAPPPATAVPAWVTGGDFCLDNTKQGLCTTAGLIQKDVLYCATGSGSSLYPFVHLSAYSETCTYGGIPYLVGTKWVEVKKGPNQDRGYSICEYLASENNSPPKVKCEGDGRACALVCSLSPNIDYKIKILNGTSKSVEILEINKVEATIYGDPIITGTATNNKLEYNISVPSKRIKEIIQGSSQFYLTVAYTLRYAGGSKNFTSVLNGVDLPKGNSAEFSITITDN